MDEEEFSGARLVGGTALALQLGHRKSVDLDLFGDIDFANIDKVKVFEKHQQVRILKASENINILLINGIKVDFVNYSYPWLEDRIMEESIRMAGLKDIAAMKLAAITGRGSKKDFVDIYFLLKHFSLRELINEYNKKYFDGSEYMVVKSLTYFEDAEQDPMPEMLKNVVWEKVKSKMVSEVKQMV